MTRELALFWNLCLLRAGPEQIPYSVTLAWASVVLWFALSLPLVFAQMPLEDARAFAFLFANAAVVFGALALLLAWRGFRSRLAQTVTAFFGTDLILNALSLPFVLPYAGMSPAEAPGAMLAQLVLFGWSIVVKGHILRSALELPRLTGWLLAVALAFGTMALMGVLFPDLIATTTATTARDG